MQIYSVKWNFQILMEIHSMVCMLEEYKISKVLKFWSPCSDPTAPRKTAVGSEHKENIHYAYQYMYAKF